MLMVKSMMHCSFGSEVQSPNYGHVRLLLVFMGHSTLATIPTEAHSSLDNDWRLGCTSNPNSSGSIKSGCQVSSPGSHSLLERGDKETKSRKDFSFHVWRRGLHFLRFLMGTCWMRYFILGKLFHGRGETPSQGIFCLFPNLNRDGSFVCFSLLLVELLVYSNGRTLFWFVPPADTWNGFVWVWKFLPLSSFPKVTHSPW